MPATPNQTLYRGPREIKDFGSIFIVPVRCLGVELESGRAISQNLPEKKYFWLGNIHIDANPTTEPTKLEKPVFNCVSEQMILWSGILRKTFAAPTADLPHTIESPNIFQMISQEKHY